MDWLIDLIDRFVTDADDATLARREALAIEEGSETAAGGFLEACRILGEAADDPVQLIDALDLLASGTVAEETGRLVIRCFAAIRADYASRQDAQAARSALSSAADRVYEPAGLAFGAEVHAFLVRLAGEAVTQISAIAATRAPVVRVETGISLPSTLAAFDLYGDAARAEEIVARNRIGTALVMPVVFEALAE
ncbi:hypothetical protein [Afifella sp. IM 167]|uniref:hypothetical protein n=1 Tax=Afifella sp. IM 167 TaxID=2033586 RepID=UPI001CCFF2FC|nr:hypothetical protein [Afifella sp. IM 167]MBZ8133221.1 hypothetical protein [Afifella sp. IM 167]